MNNSILEKVKMLRTLAVDITNCEYYGEDDAVLGNLVPADIVNALDDLTESLREELAEIEKQEPAVFMKFDASGEFVTCRLNHKGMVFDCDASYRAFYASPVQQSPALADRFKGRKLPSNPIIEIMEPNDIVEQPDSAALSDDSVNSIACTLHNYAAHLHYAGNEKLADQLEEIVLRLWKIKPSPDSAAPKQRITEQDAREISSHFVQWLNEFDDQRNATISKWLDEEGRTLLAKLNEHREPDYKAQRDLLLAAMKNYLLDIGSKENEPVQEHIQRSYKLIAAMHHAIAQCEGETK